MKLEKYTYHNPVSIVMGFHTTKTYDPWKINFFDFSESSTESWFLEDLEEIKEGTFVSLPETLKE